MFILKMKHCKISCWGGQGDSQSAILTENNKNPAQCWLCVGKMTDVKFLPSDLVRARSGGLIIIPPLSWTPPSMERDKEQKLFIQVSPDPPVITQSGYFSGQKGMVEFQTVWVDSKWVCYESHKLTYLLIKIFEHREWHGNFWWKSGNGFDKCCFYLQSAENNFDKPDRACLTLSLCVAATASQDHRNAVL